MTDEGAGTRTVVLAGVTVLDVIGERRLADQIVVVEGDRITATGDRAQVSIPAAAEVHDLPDHWVLPGLVDMHCHVTMPYDDVPLELFLANGVTAVRDPGGRVTAQRALRQSVDAGTRVGPRLFISGEFLDGDPPVWPEASHVVDTVERGVAAVRHLAAQGVDLVKIYNHVPEPVLVAIVEAAGEARIPVVGHVPRALSMRRAIQLGLTDLEHVRITGADFLSADEAERIDSLPLARREPLLWSRIRLEDRWVDDLIQEMVRSRVTLDPTLLVDEMTFVAGRESQRAHPDNSYLPPASLARWRGRPVPALMQVPDPLRASAREGNLKRQEFVRRCAQAGVRIVAGTDGTGLGRLLPGFGLHHELALLRRAGLTAFGALRAATICAAQALRLDSRLGSITVGKAADLGVWSADPLTTHLRPSDLTLVLASGRPLRPGDLLEAARAGSAYSPSQD